MKSFASDNYSGVHPDIMQALIKANLDHAASYGGDEYTLKAIHRFQEIFGSETEVFFVYNGTGANVVGLSALSKSFNSVICSELAHINVDESTAPEKFTSCKLIGLPTTNGKIYPNQVEQAIRRVGDQHHPQAKVISISQSTEYGTVYSQSEMQAMGEAARKHNLYFHVDGSRICNAAASLGTSLREITRDVGVDILSFGGTKNGMMFGEAVLVFNKVLAENLQYLRKQGMQLHSKMRFIGAQFDALLTNDLWRKSATHSNAMAKRLELGLRSIPQVRITQPVDANGVFAIIPGQILPKLQEDIFFYIWNDDLSEARLMCSFDTTPEEVDRFVEKTRLLVQSL